MKSNKIIKIMAAAMTAAMLASAVPASAAALGTSTLEPLPPMHVVQEVYGDLNGLYFDMGYTYTDGSYVIQNPMAVSRSMQRWGFEFFLSYHSGSTIDNAMGNGITSTYHQRLLKNDDTQYTYIDEKGVSHTIWYNERTGEASSPDGKVELSMDEYRYKLSFDGGYQRWFDREGGDLIVYFTNTNVDDATKIYRDEDGFIQEVLCRDSSYYRFNYEMLADGSRRVTTLDYAQSYSGEAAQTIRFHYDADGNLTGTVNETETGFDRGYTYTYREGKLFSAYNILYGGTMTVLSAPGAMPGIGFQKK